MLTFHVLRLFIIASVTCTFFVGIFFMLRTSEEDEMRSFAKQVVYDHKSKAVHDDHKSKAVHDDHKNQVVHDDHKSKAVHDDHKGQLEPIKVITLPSTDKKTSKRVHIGSYRQSVHIFYYPWYGNPAFDDGRYYHWNHPLLRPNPGSNMKPGKHNPPGDIASSFYPQLGPYSSRDPAVIDRHMRWISSAGVDAVAVSWYPEGKADEQGVPWNSLIPSLLNAADKYKLKLTFHLEPYPGQTVESIRNDIAYVIKTYGKYSAFYRTYPKRESSKALPLFYVYDSYKIPNEDWMKIATINGSMSIRNTEFDSILIGLALKVYDINTMAEAGFDGVYTYFAADGFTEGSTMTNWPRMSALCAEKSLLFIPSIGPGYDDTRIRPWNAQNTRSRNNGSYYLEHFEAAHAAKADLLSITSFNEFHESTQIEPAVMFKDENATSFVYQHYEKGPEQYLQLTREMIYKLFVPRHENIPMEVAKIV